MAAPTEFAPTAMIDRHAPVAVYLASFFVVGLSMSVLGPALTDLRERSGADIGGIGVLFIGQSTGYIVGSLAIGRLYDRFDGHRVFAAAMATLAVGMAFVPVFDSLAALFVVFVLTGVGASAADVGANLLLIWELGARVARAMNLLHLSFGLGALSAPLFVHLGLDLTARSSAVACALLAAWTLAVRSPVAPAPAAPEAAGTAPRVLVVLASFFLLYVGLEVAFSGWIHTYAGEIEFDELGATWLTTTFWIGFTIGRLGASVIGPRVAPSRLLTASCTSAVLAAVVLVVGDGRAAPVWAGTALMGLAAAPQFPVMLTFLERRIAVTGAATAWFIGAAGVGGVVFPWLVGRWFDASGPSALPWSMLLLTVLTFGSLVLSRRTVVGDPP